MKDVFITYSAGIFILSLRKSQETIWRYETINYHEIGSIVSNWICNEIEPFNADKL